MAGMVTLEDLYCDGFFESFEDLVKQFNIPRSQFFKYLQLHHLLLGIFGSSTSAPKDAEVLDKVLKSDGKVHTCVLFTDDSSMSLGNGALSALKETWERDLNMTLEDRFCKNVEKILK